MRSARLLIIALLLCASTASAQEAGPRTDALLERVERGEAQARKDAETLAWQWIKLVAEKGRLPSVELRAMARTLLLLQEPLPPPDKGLTLEQRPFRGAAVHALQSALTQDSADSWSASQLERIAPYPYIWIRPDEELAVLRALTRRSAAIPSALLVTRIRLELERGSADAAANLLAVLPAHATTPAARAHLAAEVAFAQRRDTVGAAMYYEGASAIRDSADADWFTRDLTWIATSEELSEWNALAPAAREAWLEKFWNRRDINDGQLPGTRLPEQFRRWRVALRDYRWAYDGSTAEGIIIPHQDGVEYNRILRNGGGDIPFPKDPTVSGLEYLNRMRPLTQVLDDRGGLFLRHGNPTVQVYLPGITARSEQTLQWSTPTGPLVVSFSRMVDSVPVVEGGAIAGVASERFGMVARNYPVGDLMANCSADPRLCVLAGKWLQGPRLPGTLAYSSTILADYKQMRETAEKTDGNPDTFAKDLATTVQAYGIPDLGTLVVFAIPANGLVANSRRVAETKSFGARLRIVVGDAARGEFAAALDTTRNWSLADTPNDSTQLTGFIVVPTPTGTWSVSTVLSDLARTTGSGQRLGQIPVVAFDHKTFRLGDAILGSPESGLSWQHDGVVIPLNPRNAWRPTEPAVLTYEVDGLVVGRSYETTVQIWAAGTSAKTPANAISFTTTAGDTRVTLQRELSLHELALGDYRVVLRIRDTVTGDEVTRDRKLVVRK